MTRVDPSFMTNWYCTDRRRENQGRGQIPAPAFPEPLPDVKVRETRTGNQSPGLLKNLSHRPGMRHSTEVFQALRPVPRNCRRQSDTEKKKPPVLASLNPWHGDCRTGRIGVQGNGVSAAGVADGLDAGDRYSRPGRRQDVCCGTREAPGKVRLLPPGRRALLNITEHDGVTGSDRRRRTPAMDDGSPVGIIMGIKNQRFSRRPPDHPGEVACNNGFQNASSMPMPSLADARMSLSGSRPRSISICFLTRSMSAEGRSYFVDDGNDLKTCASMAR